jgi:predicted O-methyltransferase YrrM
MALPFKTLDEALKLFNADFADTFAKVEAIRDELRASGRTISYMDYGAGTPDMELTQEEMRNGRKVEKDLKEVCGWGMKGQWAEFMFGMTAYLKPKKVLELGTCCGFSSSYMALGSPMSRIITIEGAPEICSVAGEVHARLGIDNITRVTGRFTDVLDDILKEHGHFDAVFIDGHHAYEPTVAYFKKIAPYSDGAYMIFDDISWSDGMKKAWDDIVASPETADSADMGKAGVILCKAG